jgi:prepilin-type N-terminal cleavage/methylation domain-containing protein
MKTQSTPNCAFPEAPGEASLTTRCQLPQQVVPARRKGQCGFSLVEVMLAVVMIAVLASIAIATFGRTDDGARRLVLEGDANMLNKAVQTYVASGGSLEGATSPGAVVAKLKTTTTVDQSQKIAGMRGPFIDLRLDLVPASASDQASLLYDASTGMFKVTEGNAGMVPNLNETLAEAAVTTEDRHVSLALAKQEKWVWDYKDKAAPDKVAPVRPTGTNVVATTPTNPTPNPQALPLNPPEFSQPGFELGPNDFPQVVTLTNANPTGSSEILYRMNGGAWTRYETGLSIPLQATTKIEAYATPLTVTWKPSTQAVETFTFRPGQLTVPVISPASGSFNYDEFPTSLTITDTNAPETAILQYRIGDGAWTNYSAPVSLTPEASLVVAARALPIDSQRWLASTEATAMYDLTQKLLQSPVFAKAAGLYPATDYPLTVAITNPNPAGSSTLQYREQGGVWADYNTPVLLNYDKLDVTLESRAIPVDPLKWLASPVRPSRYQLVKSQLKPPVVTPPGGYYPYNSFPALATIVNPNPADTSEIWYRFGTIGAFQKYNADSPPALSKDNYQSTLVVYAQTLLAAQFTNSNEVTEQYETIYFVGATTGLFHTPTPDTTTGGSNHTLVTNLPPPAQGPFFAWGKTQGTPGLTQSSMTFVGTPTFKAAPGEWFYLGKLTYYNGTIVSGTGAGGINMKFAFNISQPTSTTTNADYLFKLINTKNIGTEAENADYVYLPTLGVPFSTTVGGRKFKLDVRFGETTANGFGNVSEFHIYEGKSATGSLYGRITEVP